MKKLLSFDFMSVKNGPVFAAFSQNILARMHNNPRYETLQPLVEGELKPAVDTFTLALQESADRSLVKLAEKRAAFQKLKMVVHKIAFEVEYLAEGNDETLVLEAGFSLLAPRKRNVEEQAPVTGLTVTSTQPGKINLRFNAAPFARVYAAEWRLDGDEKWQNSRYPSSTRVTLDGFPSRQDVWVRLTAIGANMRMSPPCEPVKVFVL